MQATERTPKTVPSKAELAALVDEGKIDGYDCFEDGLRRNLVGLAEHNPAHFIFAVGHILQDVVKRNPRDKVTPMLWDSVNCLSGLAEKPETLVAAYTMLDALFCRMTGDGYDEFTPAKVTNFRNAQLNQAGG